MLGQYTLSIFDSFHTPSYFCIFNNQKFQKKNIWIPQKNWESKKIWAHNLQRYKNLINFWQVLV